MKNSEIMGMWIVALSLVSAVGAQSALQELPQHLGSRLEIANARSPVTEFGVDEARTQSLDEVLQGISRRLFKC